MGRFAEQYLDQAMKLNMAWTVDDETAAQKARLIRMGVIAEHIAQFPRRIGGEASPAELRADKRLARQMLNRFQTVLRTWGGTNADITEEYNRVSQGERDGDGSLGDHEVLREAAQMDWEKWWQDYKVDHQATARRISTHALKLTDRKTANKLVHKLELEWQLIDDLLGLTEDPAPDEEAA